jgi:hypothetical protein
MEAKNKTLVDGEATDSLPDDISNDVLNMRLPDQ